MLKSSGDSAFDRSVEQAALKAEQFVELQSMDPALFERKFRQVDVAFILKTCDCKIACSLTAE